MKSLNVRGTAGPQGPLQRMVPFKGISPLIVLARSSCPLEDSAEGPGSQAAQTTFGTLL